MTDRNDELLLDAIQLSERKNAPGEWGVEHINMAGDGEIYMAIFSGPDAKARAKNYIEAADEIDRLTGEVKRLTLQLGGYAAGATDDMNQIVQMGMAHEEFQAKADALADLLKSALDNIQGIADDADIPSMVIREKGYAALLAYQNKEIIQGEVGKEIVENEE